MLRRRLRRLRCWSRGPRRQWWWWRITCGRVLSLETPVVDIDNG